MVSQSLPGGGKYLITGTSSFVNNDSAAHTVQCSLNFASAILTVPGGGFASVTLLSQADTTGTPTTPYAVNLSCSAAGATAGATGVFSEFPVINSVQVATLTNS